MDTAKMPTLTFYGATETVTGSKFLIETARARVLVDCGLYQGARELRWRNWDRPFVDPATLDAVIITHAHLDHCGYLPVLARNGLRCPVWASRDTAQLIGISLPDAAHVQESEAQYALQRGYSKHPVPRPLFDQADAAAALALVKGADFDTPFEVAPGITVRLGRAGHILGSAFAEIEVDGTRVLFSGDLGREQHTLLRGPDVPGRADVVVIESTYGDEVHPPADDDVLADVINRTAARGGSCLIPAFAIDRTPLMVMTLKRLMHEGKIVHRVPIYVDSPMALHAWEVYRNALDRDDDQFRKDLDHHSLDWEHGVVAVFDPFESARLNDPVSPCIIVSASGMASGGRVLHHLRTQLPDKRNAVIFSGYQVPGTRGYQLVEGAQQLKIQGEYIPVRAEIVTLPGMSAHADALQAIDWVSAAGSPSCAYVVHGEPSAATQFAGRLSRVLGWTAVVPRYGERVALPAPRGGADRGDDVVRAEPARV
ncbi:MAG TPA: MBL fold metallo-hydrolase [Marmoricola sp.]|nr:MBL fold metallo-hydrolase [Marmoricola sp.]